MPNAAVCAAANTAHAPNNVQCMRTRSSRIRAVMALQSLQPVQLKVAGPPRHW